MEFYSLKKCSFLFIFVICFTSHLSIKAQSTKEEPFKSDYLNYIPDFIAKMKGNNYWNYSEKEMERSSETKFYTLNEVEEVNRANALVKVAIESEESGDFRKAMTMYQDIINKFSIASNNNEVLYRVSSYGVFVPVAQYCQRRLLNFPKEHLDFFRTLRDPEAKELFDEAVKKYSLDLFSEIVDKYLATTYGGKSLMFLGDAALDRGNYLEALEYFKTILQYIPDQNLLTPELNLKVQFCEKALGQKVSENIGAGKSNMAEKDILILKTAIEKVAPAVTKIHTQRTSSDYTSVDDYTRFKPSADPLGLEEPEWENDLLSSRNDNFVYTQPVITDTSVVFRHKNIIYSYSLINGSLRWKNDVGGRAVAQDWNANQIPLEDIIIQDGVVVTPLIKGGSSLVALDETTGQIKWSYGPISASDGEESRMRFECAPTAGPSTIYANYVLDNIKGDTHIDSEYGVIAFESSTGRVKWRRQVCRLQPGKFDGSFGSVRRNRIRSFFSPPVYHEGTVYVNSNSGAVTAMDSLSGRIKWLMRYPYHPSVHDLSRQFGSRYQYAAPNFIVLEPSFWLNQRPLVLGEQLYILPIDSPFLLCLDRRTGKVNWTFSKPTTGFSYLLGPLSTGEMVVTGNGRAIKSWNGAISHPIYLLDPNTGKVTWASPDVILNDSQPVMNSSGLHSEFPGISMNSYYFETGARPFLSENDKIILTSWNSCSLWWKPGGAAYALAEVDLKNRTILGQRRFYNGTLLSQADGIINDDKSLLMERAPIGAPLVLKWMKAIPRLTKEQEVIITRAEAIIKDTVPVNAYPAFMPFSRITFMRYGLPFELRIYPRKISLLYKRADLESNLAKDNSLVATFGKAELSVKDGDYKKASEYLNQCLVLVSPEDVNFRALLKQQFYKVYLELSRSSVRANKPKLFLENALGMSNTASVLAEEIESLFVLSDAYQKNGNVKNASACLRTLIEVYGQHEYPISSLLAKSLYYQEEMPQIQNTLSEIISEAKANTSNVYKKETQTTLDLISKSHPLYFSSVSPLPKEISVRAGDLAILKLIDLLKNSSGYESEYSKLGETELAGDKIDQLIFHIWKYPGTQKGQETYNRVCSLVKNLPEEDKRDVMRKLIHVAKICKFKVPVELSSFSTIPAASTFKEVNTSFGEKNYEVKDFKDGIMITLEREGDLTVQPSYLFLSVKLPKKKDFKFSVVCFDMNLGKEIWRKDEFRLKDEGREPGFFKAFVYQDTVVVNGIYDVFGFNINTGQEIWHYKVPYSFEIEEATLSGNIFAISGSSETIALQVETKSPIGEVAWQQKEEGTIYNKPYFLNDLFISVRKYPFNITSRFRTTGSLLARLALPDLSMVSSHPILNRRCTSFAR
jgi:outer membrane protein assembly factor BamB/tetratricopeptide (TPR) repeat protein